MRFVGQDRWLEWKRFLFLTLIPAATILFAFTNDSHLVLWEGYHYTPVGDMLAFSVDRGPWFYVHMLYSYILTFTGTILILNKFVRSISLYQKQSIWLVIGAVTPIIVNVIYVLGITPNLKKDHTPVSFAVGGIALMLGMLRHRLFDVHPIARSMVVNGLGDAVFVLDEQNRVIDANPAALSLLGLGAGKVIGQPARTVFAPWQDLLDRFAHETEIRTEISIGEGESAIFYDLRLSTLADRSKNAIGRIIVLHEIS